MHGISWLINYPLPLYLQEAYHCLGVRQGSFPIPESLSSEVLSSPIGPHLFLSHAHTVCAVMR